MSAYTDDPFYMECVPTRPSPPDPYRMALGPTAQWDLLQLEAVVPVEHVEEPAA